MTLTPPSPSRYPPERTVPLAAPCRCPVWLLTPGRAGLWVLLATHRSSPLSWVCPESYCCLQPLSMQPWLFGLQQPNEISSPAKASPRSLPPTARRATSCSGEPPSAKRPGPALPPLPASNLGPVWGSWKEEEGSCPALETLHPSPDRPSGVSGGGRGQRGRQTGLKMLPCFVSFANSTSNLGGAHPAASSPPVNPWGPVARGARGRVQPSRDPSTPAAGPWALGHQAGRSGLALGFPATLLAGEGEQLSPSAPVQPSSLPLACGELPGASPGFPVRSPAGLGRGRLVKGGGCGRDPAWGPGSRRQLLGCSCFPGRAPGQWPPRCFAPVPSLLAFFF